MSIRDVLAPVLRLDEDEGALRLTQQIAARFEGRGAALIVAVHPGSSFAEHEAPLSEVLEDAARGPDSAAAQERARIGAWLALHAPDFEAREIEVGDAVTAQGVVTHARMADLTVLAQAGGHARARRAMLERVLFQSGRPVLLVPQHWRGQDVAARILIGWKPSREAVRAVNDAMPFLRAAQAVTIATVDARPGADGYGAAPGHDLAAHLARHGVSVDVRHVDGMGRSEALALAEQASALGADLLVMGAYGRSRAEEMLFGGVTRELLGAPPLPLLLSH